MQLWESLLNDTKQHSKYHQVFSEICSKYVIEKFDEIHEDRKRIFNKCRIVNQTSQGEIFKVINELHGVRNQLILGEEMVFLGIWLSC
jgi:hypothetical protein